MKVVFVLYGDKTEIHEQAGMMVASAKRFGHYLIQLADDVAPRIEGVDEVIRKPKNDPYSIYRLSRLLEVDPPFLSVDTDLLFLRHTEDIAGPYDAVLTERDEALMPYNSGVFWIGRRGFLEQCLDEVLAMPEEKQAWLGDQLALAKVAQNWDIKALPCRDWNLTAGQYPETSETRIVHFKGERRKHLMKPRFERL